MNKFDNRGLSLIELLVSVSIAGLLMLAINGILGLGIKATQTIQEKNELTRQAQFALNLIVQTLQSSPRLLLPLVDNPLTTTRNESVRGDTSYDHGVVAITLNHFQDLDANGTPDADNDGDGLFDEDLPADSNNDNRRGIAFIDDDKKNGPELSSLKNEDDDEEINYTNFFQSSLSNEDPINNIDDDGDGSIDEDPPADMNNDGCSGACDVDEDGDGNNNEDDPKDDDEDGQVDEDWYDSVVFYEKNGSLYQRKPVPWDENGDGKLTGADYVESVIADNVTLFIVKRIPQNNISKRPLISLTLELTSASDEKIQLTTQVRVGGGL